MKALLITLSLALLLAPGTPVAAADKWTEVRSRNFVVVGDATERQIRDVAENLEQFREAFDRLFPRNQVKSSTATTIVVFRNDAAFRPFKPVYQGKPANLDGYFQAGDDVNYVALAAGGATPRIIYHEYVHLLTTDSTGTVPAWFREGLAEYYSTFVVSARDRKFRVGAPIGEHIEYLRQNGFMPLDALFRVDRESPEYNEASRQGVFYAQSWALVHYLLLGDDGKRRPQLLQFLNQIADGTPDLQSFQTVFKTDTLEFQKLLQNYVGNQSRWAAAEYQLKDALTVEKDMLARTLSEAESEFYLGDLLLHTDRVPEAEAHLKVATNLDPMLAGPQASMGLLRMRQRNYAEASQYLKRASELDSSNALAHYYYASVLDKQSADARLRPSEDQLEIMRAELMKSIELAPNFVEAAEALGRVNLIRNENLDETTQLLRKALEVSPGRETLILMLANVLAQTSDPQSPRPLLEQLINSTSAQASIKREARSLLEYLDRAADQIGFAEVVASDLPADLVDDKLLPSPAAPVEPVDVPADRRNVLEPLQPVGPQVEGEKIQGMLTLLDCASGMTMSVNVDGRTVTLHSDNPDRIQFLSYTSSVATAITCGPTRAPGIPVVITYRAGKSGGALGEPLVVEFIEKK